MSTNRNLKSRLEISCWKCCGVHPLPQMNIPSNYFQSAKIVPKLSNGLFMFHWLTKLTLVLIKINRLLRESVKVLIIWTCHNSYAELIFCVGQFTPLPSSYRRRVGLWLRRPTSDVVSLAFFSGAGGTHTKTICFPKIKANYILWGRGGVAPRESCKQANLWPNHMVWVATK